jgi:hypothetical protein
MLVVRLLWPKQGPSTSKLDLRVSDQKAAKELAKIIRQLWVENGGCQHSFENTN